MIFDNPDMMNAIECDWTPCLRQKRPGDAFCQVHKDIYDRLYAARAAHPEALETIPVDVHDLDAVLYLLDHLK